MNKKITLLVLLFFAPFMFSQEVSSEYGYKKEKNKSGWNFIEQDNIILYSNNTFLRTYSLQYHEIIKFQEKGTWEMKNNTLTLKIEYKKVEKWIETEIFQYYKVKKKSIIQLDNNKENRKLKKIN